MHEIPNHPFPSLNPEEPAVSAQAEPATTSEHDVEEPASAEQD
ncbi:hypothetical protein [Pseudomonas cremoricolorata]|nr:hypothetical protein [Pseudomonas cremoricolorata]